MSQWVRLWEDMPTDPKFRVVAKRSGRPVSEVLAVFVHMMTNAANAPERGELSGWDDEAVAIAIDAETDHITAIREAMQGRTLAGEKLTGWDKRQPLREDNSAERAKAWREEQKRKKNQLAPNQTHANAPERNQTLEAEAEAEAEAEENRKARQAGLEASPASEPPPALPPDQILSLGQLCEHALAGTDWKPKGDFGPMAALMAYGADPDRIAGILKAEAAKRPKPVATWPLCATIVSERLAEAKPAGPRLVGQPAALKTGEFVNVDGLKITAGMAQQAKAKGHWPSFYGPPPGQPGCRIPDRFFRGVA